MEWHGVSYCAEGWDSAGEPRCNAERMAMVWGDETAQVNLGVMLTVGVGAVKAARQRR